MWEWADAWILQSVVYAGRRGQLPKVIANADAINVDIPPREQLERAVQRLEAAGLVDAQGLHIRATRDGKRIVRQCERRGDGIRGVAPRIEATLKRQVPFPERIGEWTLTQQAWQAAYDDYYHSTRSR